MKVHGLRPELQPTVVNEKTRLAKEASAQEAEKASSKAEVVVNSSRLLDLKG